MKTTLEASVIAFNRVHDARNKLQVAYIEALKPFIGKKVTKASGGWTEQVKKALPVKPDNIQTWLAHQSTGLCISVKTSENYGEFNATYAEAYFYCGVVEGQTLVKVSEPQSLRCDYTVEEVLEKRKAFELASEAARQAESALSPFKGV